MITLFKYPLVFFLLFLNARNAGYAQTTIRIETSENRSPLAFASIINYSKKVIVFSDQTGNATIKFDNGDSIIISYVGYDDLRFIFDKQHSTIYQLTQSKAFLNTVEIKACIPKKIFEYSNEEDNPQQKFGGLTWNFPSDNAKVAVMVRPEVKNAYAISFSFWLLNNIQAPKVAIQAPMKISFYEIVDSTSLPGELITNRQVIYFPKREGKQVIDLDSIRLKIPGNGMYIGIEYIIDEKYKYPVRYIDTARGIDSIRYSYGGRIDGAFSTKYRIAFYNYFEDNWFYGGKRNKLEMEQPHGTIKCSLRIKYCE